jgi:YegS/Rv2252/BmrU family lipid kinase
MSERPRRVRIIVNPISGLGWMQRRAEKLRRRLVEAGCDAELCATERAGHGGDLAREAADLGFDVVVAAGGDGTINDVIQGLALTETALGILPMGTANVLATELNLGDFVWQAVRLVLRGARRRLDLGRCGDRYFVCFASVGYDAFVVQCMAEWRKGTITHLSYFGPMWKAFVEYPFAPLRVKVDGKELDRPVYHFVMGNTRSYGGSFQITTRAHPDDGLLDACAFGGDGHGWLFIYLACTVCRMHQWFGNVRMLRGKRFEIDGPRPLPFQFDGDFRGFTPVTFEVVPKAITVLVPQVRR